MLFIKNISRKPKDLANSVSRMELGTLKPSVGEETPGEGPEKSACQDIPLQFHGFSKGIVLVLQIDLTDQGPELTTLAVAGKLILCYFASYEECDKQNLGEEQGHLRFDC